MCIICVSYIYIYVSIYSCSSLLKPHHTPSFRETMGTGASAALMQNAAVRQKAGKKIFSKKKEKKENLWSTPVVPLVPSDSDEDHGAGFRLTASWQRKNKSEVMEQRPTTLGVERIPAQRGEYHVHKTMVMLNAVEEISEETDFDDPDPREALDF